ncbi:uncharacterized protein [Rutidosis leptorrhynchoides]|uniref:uncharacterized protein n=1 Tax=Rutidosis leptorrhynchoides TaxID=125765 RepID=UPI003A98F771
MSNLRTICRLNHAVYSYSSLTCCYNRARLIVSLSYPIQNPNSSKPRLIDSSNVKKMETLSWSESTNHQRRMLASSASWTDEKSPYDTLAENVQQDKQIAAEAETERDVKTVENMQQEDEIASKETKEEDESDIEDEFDLVCFDGIEFDAKLFLRESLMVREAYDYCVWNSLAVETNSEIIKMVELFCVERAKIHDDYAGDEALVQHKLNEFNSNFRQANRKHALDLMTAAFNMKMRSLVDVMMEDIIDIFAKMTEDEAYKILFVNLKDNYNNAEFTRFNKRVMFNTWAYEDL